MSIVEVLAQSGEWKRYYNVLVAKADNGSEENVHPKIKNKSLDLGALREIILRFLREDNQGLA